MPLVYQQNINENTKLGLWHILEAEPFFLKTVPLQKEITHPHKRLQHLAGRYLLKALFPAFPLELIEIADTQKPFLSDELYHFSISHCRDYAAVMVSRNCRVGVDVEWPQPKIELVKHKFLLPGEFEVLQNFEDADELYKLTTAWSSKEAIFKWYGLGQLDFKKHMVIHQMGKMDDEIITDCMLQKTLHFPVKVFSKNIEGNVLAWIYTPA